MEEKTIYELDLHESIILHVDLLGDDDGYPYKWQVTRVPGGWFYQDSNISRTTVSQFFVPYDREFAPNYLVQKQVLELTKKLDDQLDKLNDKPESP